MNLKVLVDGEEIETGAVLSGASIVEAGPDTYSVLWNGRCFDARISGNRVFVNGRAFDVEVADPRELQDSGPGAAAHGRAEIVSPMPGKVIRLLVEPGQEVEAGQGILVVEAMKMQNELGAPRKGTVTSIRTQPGAAVAGGEVLAVVE